MPPSSPGYGLEDRRRVLLRPVDGEGAAIHEHYHERLAGSGERLKQLTLDGGQRDVSAVASAEALDVYRHFFAFEIGREADEGDDDIRLLCCGNCPVPQSLARRAAAPA